MTEEILLQMVRYFGNDIKRIGHAIKVYGFAQSIIAGEGIAGNLKLTTELAAILHDIGIKEAERKHKSSAGHFQEIEGPPIARRILSGCGISGEISDRVCYLIGHHHTYNKIDGIDFQILVEADFLVNIHEGFIKPDAAPSVVNRYFKTATASELALSVYGIKI